VSPSEKTNPANSTVEAPSAVDHVEKIRKGFEEKAKHNKNEALGCLMFIMIATGASPLFIAFGPEPITGKVLPSLLSLVAGGLTGWLQLRRPQQLWGIYREAQRQIEDQVAKFKFKVGDYTIPGDRKGATEKLLIERVCAIALAAHDAWKGVLPGPESLKTTSNVSETDLTKVGTQ
jgi:hypothetical protein